MPRPFTRHHLQTSRSVVRRLEGVDARPERLDDLGGGADRELRFDLVNSFGETKNQDVSQIIRLIREESRDAMRLLFSSETPRLARHHEAMHLGRYGTTLGFLELLCWCLLVYLVRLAS